MAATPYLTSDALIACIKRKFMIPVSQDTFTNYDFLAFLNEELMISQVPSVLEYHQEYFTYTKTVNLITTQKYYPIPDRAIGMKLRAVFLADMNGNLYEMTRVQSEDRTFFQSGNGSVNTVYTYYLQGNNVVLTSDLSPVPPSNLVFVFFIRPNQLVPNNRAATIESFQRTITLVSVQAGDTVTFTSTDGFTGTVYTTVFTAVSGSPGPLEFQIGGSDVITATNLANSINASEIASATNLANTSSTVSASFDLVDTDITTSNDTTIFISSNTLTINCNQVPTTIINDQGLTETVFQNGELVDFLQTNPGHSTRAYDVRIPSNGISGNSITFDNSEVPLTLVVGDYIAVANECIIPQIPPDLHNGLAERAGARMLAALGDQQGLQNSLAKIKEIDLRQGQLLDNRVEGNPIKVTNRHSPLAYNKMNSRRLM